MLVTVAAHAAYWHSVTALKEACGQLKRGWMAKLAIRDLKEAESEALATQWGLFARDDQLPPVRHFRNWLMMGGRGAGKTRAGAEWLRALVEGSGAVLGDSAGRVALVGETFQDVRDVMIEGESGLLAVHRKDTRPAWYPSRRVLEWPNGAIGQVFSASDPDGLRGSQFGAAWSDELAKWRYPEAFDMLQFCLRLGNQPRQLITTTPRPVRLLKKLLADRETVVSRAATHANAGNLPEAFIAHIEAEYAGTRLGRQEIGGELIEDRENALWTRAQLDGCREARAPDLKRIVVAIDPPATSTKKSDACGIIVAGIDPNGLCHVLEDCTVQGVTPAEWSATAIAAYHRHKADSVVAEVNQGGDMVVSVLAGRDATVPVIRVRASRGKWLRAEPVAMLYSADRVRHAGRFPQLEDEMCDFAPSGLSDGRSPDRLDALVWALFELALKIGSTPRIRAF